MAKQKLVNNGLPAGIHFKDIKPGMVVITTWDDEECLPVLVTQNFNDNNRRDYRGPVSFRGYDEFGDRVSFGGAQVVSVSACRPLKYMAGATKADCTLVVPEPHIAD